MPRLDVARRKLFPNTCSHSNGLTGFTEWEHGYNAPTFAQYVNTQRARMLPYLTTIPKWMVGLSDTIQLMPPLLW